MSEKLDDLRDECVRLLREMLPALSGLSLPPRAENICFAASNRLARIDGELAAIAAGREEAGAWAEQELARAVHPPLYGGEPRFPCGCVRDRGGLIKCQFHGERSEHKEAERDTERPEPASFVFRDSDWPPPANGAPVHGLAQWLAEWQREERAFFGVDRDAVSLGLLRPMAEPEAGPLTVHDEQDGELTLVLQHPRTHAVVREATLADVESVRR